MLYSASLATSQNRCSVRHVIRVIRQMAALYTRVIRQMAALNSGVIRQMAALNIHGTMECCSILNIIPCASAFCCIFKSNY